ncbi:MAG: phosphate/phosphite/phosphonate ABC transporter substrate-binding protein, partial [Gammaproteobacteria bacterium]|nr:phosphate/phosphite/phosphonate ABC transporter substrate-binding protein [Gammaproteobacteria bacterium]
YAFSNAEINSAAWVHKGIVSAAAFSNLDWSRESSAPPAIRARLKVIHETEPVPRALEVVRGDLDPAVSDRLRSILVNMASDQLGKRTLAEYQSTTRFDAIPEADRQRLDLLQDQIPQLETRW